MTLTMQKMISFSEAEEIYQSEKTLVGPYQWIFPSNSGRNQSCLTCKVEMAGALPRGVLFRATAYPTFLDTFTFQLECASLSSRSGIPLYRLEVNPLSAHTNRFYGPEELRGLRLPARTSHEHDFHDNLTENGDIRNTSLPQARPMKIELSDFATALGFVCDKVNIANRSDVPHPPSQGVLL